MWNYSPADDKWNKTVDKLDKKVFNYLRQEIEDLRFYSKCLEGTSYVASQDLTNLYDVMGHKDNITYKKRRDSLLKAYEATGQKSKARDFYKASVYASFEKFNSINIGKFG